jgi:hypothetical protein
MIRGELRTTSTAEIFGNGLWADYRRYCSRSLFGVDNVSIAARRVRTSTKEIVAHCCETDGVISDCSSGASLILHTVKCVEQSASETVRKFESFSSI